MKIETFMTIIRENPMQMTAIRLVFICCFYYYYYCTIPNVEERIKRATTDNNENN